MTTQPRNNPSGRPGRVVLLVILAGMITTLATPAAVRADKPWPSGTILSGNGSSPMSPGIPGREGCLEAADCAVWFHSGCDTDLVGRNPAIHASVVEVAHLADGTTPREVSISGVWRWGQVMVQFWSSACKEIPRSRWASGGCAWRCSDRTFLIPVSAQWMTVSSRPDNFSLHWRLT